MPSRSLLLCGTMLLAVAVGKAQVPDYAASSIPDSLRNAYGWMHEQALGSDTVEGPEGIETTTPVNKMTAADQPTEKPRSAEGKEVRS